MKFVQDGDVRADFPEPSRTGGVGRCSSFPQVTCMYVYIYICMAMLGLGFGGTLPK